MTGEWLAVSGMCGWQSVLAGGEWGAVGVSVRVVLVSECIQRE